MDGEAEIIGLHIRGDEPGGRGEFARDARIFQEETDGGKVELPEGLRLCLQQGKEFVPIIIIVGRCFVGRVQGPLRADYPGGGIVYPYVRNEP